MIVLGSVAALGAFFQLVSSLMMPYFAEMQTSISASAPPTVPVVTPYATAGAFMTETIALNALLLGAAVWQVVAGAMLYRRRQMAPTLCRLWALTRVGLFALYMGLTAIVQTMMMRQMTDAVQSAASASGGGGPPVGTIMGGIVIAGLVFLLLYGLVWGWGLAAVVWVWLGRRKTRQEIAAWGAPGEDAGGAHA